MASPSTNISRGFARSEELQGQWDDLRTRLQAATDGGDDAQVLSLQRRMESIKLEMAELVSRTKRNLPTFSEDDDDHDEHDLAQALIHHHSHRDSLSPSGCSQSEPVQYSAHKRHIVRRTYDSTDDDDENQNNNRNNNDNGSENDNNNSSSIDTAILRQQLMESAEHVDAVVMTVEHQQHSHHSSTGRQLAATLKRGLRGAFKQNRAIHGNNSDSGSSSAAAAAKTGSGNGRHSKVGSRSTSAHSNNADSNDERWRQGELAEDEDIENDVNSAHGDHFLNNNNKHAPGHYEGSTPSPAPTPPSSVRDDDDDFGDLAIPGGVGNGGGSAGRGRPGGRRDGSSASGASSTTSASASASARSGFKDRGPSRPGATGVAGVGGSGSNTTSPNTSSSSHGAHNKNLAHLTVTIGKKNTAPSPQAQAQAQGHHNSSMTYLGPLTQEERENLAIEQSRLERESRRLRRKPDRSKTDDNRLLDIASQLSKLSSTLADNVTVRNLRTPRTPTGNKATLSGTRTPGVIGAGPIGPAKQGQGQMPQNVGLNKSLNLPRQGHASGVVSHGLGQGGGQGGGLTPTGPQPDLAKQHALVQPADMPTRKASRSKHPHNRHTGGQQQQQGERLMKTHDGTVLSPVTDDGLDATHRGGNVLLERKYPDAATTRPASSSTAHGHGHHNTTTSSGNSTNASPATQQQQAHLRTPNSGKRKKTWMSFEASMNSLKTLGRSVRNTAMSGRGTSSTTANDHGHGQEASPSSSSSSAVGAVRRRASTSGGNSSSGGSGNNSSSGGGNVPRKRGTVAPFGELNERLAERGEKLHGVADASEKMAGDANDMLAAARALRMKQQQKSKGFFS